MVIFAIPLHIKVGCEGVKMDWKIFLDCEPGGWVSEQEVKEIPRGMAIKFC